MITLYQWEMSPFCDKVRRVLHVKKQQYEVRELDLAAALTGRLRKINPTGKVPAIEHDGQFIGDSTNIAHYVEKMFPEPALIPKDPAARALVHVLEDWADESLYFYEVHLRIVMKHNALKWVPELTKNDHAFVRAAAKFAVPLATRSRTRAQGVGMKSPDMIHEDLERHVEAVNGLLGDRSWLVGNALTLADIAVFVQLFCIRATVEGWPIVHGWPKVASWMDRVDGATQA
jgi:glutathione S-transferase